MLEQLEDLHELIYVDDGSRDQTAEILQELQAGDEHVRVVLLSRNFGHQIAVTAGLEHASGEAVVVIDADYFPTLGQNHGGVCQGNEFHGAWVF